MQEIQKPNEGISNVWAEMADRYASAMIKKVGFGQCNHSLEGKVEGP